MDILSLLMHVWANERHRIAKRHIPHFVAAGETTRTLPTPHRLERSIPQAQGPSPLNPQPVDRAVSLHPVPPGQLGFAAQW